MKEVKNKFDCTVKDSDEIFITIVAGDGQTVSSYFEKPDLEPVNGPVDHVYLGKGSLLKGRSIPIISMVTQTNPDTAWASITYILTSTPKTEQTYSDQFDPEDNSLRFITTITFK